jgi:hypothetical protein
MLTQTFPGLDLKTIMHRVAADHPELSPVELEACETEYRRFLFLAANYPGMKLAPTPGADKVWHAHILFTKRYQKDCQELIGRFLHHSPYTDETPAETKRESAKNLRKLYAKHFGIELSMAGDCKECNTDSGGYCDTQACDSTTADVVALGMRRTGDCDTQACDNGCESIICGTENENVHAPSLSAA